MCISISLAATAIFSHSHNVRYLVFFAFIIANCDGDDTVIIFYLTYY